MWLSSTEYSLFGNRLVHSDKRSYPCLLVHWVEGEGFYSLPDEERARAYEVFLGIGQSPEEEKRELYMQLLALKGRGLRDFINHKRSGIRDQKANEKD